MSQLRVHALTVDRGGCFYYRVKQPLQALRMLGHWTSWGSGVDFETWDRSNVLVQQLLHTTSSAEDWIRWCEAGEKLCVWEADDDVTTVHTSPEHGSAYDQADTLPRMRRMVEASHLVTVSTPRLAEVYSAWNPNVVVLPNAIPDWLPEIPPAPEGDTRRLVMGYTGSASHFDDYEAWSPVLETWMRRNAHRTLLRYYGLSKRPIGMPLSWAADVRPWVKLTENYLLGLRMDVGVAPLLPTEFNRGKSGIKAMEYAALGVPSVVQSVPQYQAQVLHGKTGFLCDTRTEWLDALGRLWNDSGLRARMGAAAREHARETMTMSSIVPMYETAYRRAAERVGVKL